jgi:hypothetical protein
LVDEVINGRDKVVQELMGEKAVGEMDSREEDKGEGRTREKDLFWAYFGFLEGKKFWGGRRRRGGNNSFARTICLRTLTRAQLLLGILGSGPGNRKDSWS